MKQKPYKLRRMCAFLFFVLMTMVLSAQKPVIEWVDIPEGTFKMGSLTPEDRLFIKSDYERNIIVDSFKMSKYEITFEQYDQFCTETKRKKARDLGDGRGKMPAIMVDWYDANAFAEWMGGRLPTSKEWEYACRAGTTTPFYTGSEITNKQANIDGNNTKPVGSYAPNAWGLYDLHGNVQEWCSDYDKKAKKSIIRGSSYFNFRNAYPSHSEHYSWQPPDIGWRALGFRIVADMDWKKEDSPEQFEIKQSVRNENFKKLQTGMSPKEAISLLLFGDIINEKHRDGVFVSVGLFPESIYDDITYTGIVDLNEFQLAFEKSKLTEWKIDSERIGLKSFFGKYSIEPNSKMEGKWWLENGKFTIEYIDFP